MLSRIQTAFLIGIAVILWAALLLLHGEPVAWRFLAPFSSVVSGLLLVLLVFDKWLWKWRHLHPWLVPNQNLNGTWRGTLQTNWQDPRSLQRPGPIEVFVIVRQTYSTVSARLLTDESESDLLVGKFVVSEDGVADLLGMYRNTPKQSLRTRSPIHHGAFRLRLEGTPVMTLAGEYWTDRNTMGELRLTEHVDAKAHGVEHARTLFVPPPTAGSTALP
ncbi:hypothetical protein BHS09_22220 [Myxococcus xanthus]|uniref:CD-NTase-associated protein 15 domain-containing protein n=1 Tax=Myxococcus xanthus TaxID=34 RepID=A0AAE6KTS6_MYXXA|nr:hypothetical protein [Myxococcus xanthus]QDE69475.1 hypothetical protein BHS09_22220 [Myxococcus xanthus]QDE76752.1 hypothetical protein BHS08_22235 [Myxococcus xanthus]